MKDFLKKINYLLDTQDRREFIKFVFLLLIGGLISSLGLTTLILSIKGLIDPHFIKEIPIIKNLPYKHVIIITVTALITFVWIKGALTVFITQKRSFFVGNMIVKIRKKLFFAYLHTPYFFHIKRNNSELVNNINGETGVLLRLLENFAQILSDILTSFVLIIIILTISPLFAIVILIPIFLGNKLWLHLTNAKSNYNSVLRGESQTEFSKVTTYGLTGIKEIKIYQKEAFFIEKAEENAKAIVRSEIFSAVYKKSFGVLNESIPLTFMLLLILTLLLLNTNGSQLLASLTIFGLMAAQLIPSLDRIMRAVAEIKYHYFCLNKIHEELEYCASCQNLAFNESQHSQSKLNFQKNIALKNIFFKYEKKPALNDINLTLMKGKKIAFVGHSGAGKTTLVDIILGVLTPNSGEIWVDETLLSNNHLSDWYKHFGYIPQMIYVFDTTIRENIALGVENDKIDDAQVWYCLEISSLAKFVKEECPQGLDTVIGDNGIRLSGGQRQRIGIARSLYNNPTILVMDEATAALDNQTEYEVTNALNNAAKDRTIITIAHRLTTIQHYDIIHMMEMGRIIASGNYQELIKNCEAFQKLENLNS